MADPDKNSAKKSNKTIPKEPVEEEYELLPHKEIVELKEELRKLKSLPPEAGHHTEASYETLTKKMDRLIEIFEEAEKSVEVEEGAVTFKERMAPFKDKMDKILEQNSEIAEGIVALADIMNEIKDKLEVGVIYKAKEAERKEEENKPEPPRQMSMPSMGPKPPGSMAGQERPAVPMGMPPPTPGKMPGPIPQSMMGNQGMPQQGGPSKENMPMPPPQGLNLSPPPLPRQGAPMPSPGPMPPPPKKKGLFSKK